MSERTVKQKGNKKSLGKHLWQPGESGNPNGRPKKQICIPDILRRLLAEQDEFVQDKRTKLESICHTAINQAIGGDKDARNWIADRAEGKALERVLSGELEKDELVIE